MTITIRPWHLGILAFALGSVLTAALVLAFAGGGSGGGDKAQASAPAPTATVPPPTTEAAAPAPPAAPPAAPTDVPPEPSPTPIPPPSVAQQAAPAAPPPPPPPPPAPVAPPASVAIDCSVSIPVFDGVLRVGGQATGTARFQCNGQAVAGAPMVFSVTSDIGLQAYCSATTSSSGAGSCQVVVPQANYWLYLEVCIDYRDRIFCADETFTR